MRLIEEELYRNKKTFEIVTIIKVIRTIYKNPKIDEVYYCSELALPYYLKGGGDYRTANKSSVEGFIETFEMIYPPDDYEEIETEQDIKNKEKEIKDKYLRNSNWSLGGGVIRGVVYTDGINYVKVKDTNISSTRINGYDQIERIVGYIRVEGNGGSIWREVGEIHKTSLNAFYNTYPVSLG